ncbi:hypothetical protein [Thermosporothrix hazakensis]|nr:hypothetical protein [Thermosporothrix hazakensis]
MQIQQEHAFWQSRMRQPLASTWLAFFGSFIGDQGKPERPLGTRMRAHSTRGATGTISQRPFWPETNAEELPMSLPPRC